MRKLRTSKVSVQNTKLVAIRPSYKQVWLSNFKVRALAFVSCDFFLNTDYSLDPRLFTAVLKKKNFGSVNVLFWGFPSWIIFLLKHLVVIKIIHGFLLLYLFS